MISAKLMAAWPARSLCLEARARTLCQLAARRPYARRDSERLRHTLDGSFVMPRANPGVRIEPDFVTAPVHDELVAVCRESAALYGYEYDGDTRSLSLDSEGAIERSSDLVNNVRVTGRLERPDLSQRLPPWGYGEVFSEAALPGPLRALASRVGELAPRGSILRDVTMNGRQNSFFQLDPHVDPLSDGPDVFILSLLSTVVLTFTPSVEV